MPDVSLADRLLSSGDAALRLGISRYTLHRAARKGAIVPVTKTPGGFLRFRANDIDAYARQLRGAPDGPSIASANNGWLPAPSARGPLDDADDLRLIYGSMACGVLLNGPTGAVLYANDAAVRMVGLSAEQLQGKAALDRGWRAAWEDGSPIAGDDYPAQIALRTGQAQRGVTFSVQLPDGETRWLQVDAVPVADASGTLTHVVTSLADVSSRRQTEAALRESEARFRATFEQSAVGIMHIDTSGHITLVNEQLSTLLGFQRQDLLGMSLDDLYIEGDRGEARRQIDTLLRGQAPAVRSEQQLASVCGKHVWVVLTLSLVRGRDNLSEYLIAIVQDVSGQKQAEERLRLLEAAVVHARDAVVITEVDRGQSRFSPVVYVNDAFTRMTGYGSDEIVGRPSSILDGPETDTTSIHATYDALLAGTSSQAELLTYRKDGSTYWADYSVVPIRDARGRVSHWISFERDMTERRATAEALRASEAQLRTVLMNAPVILSSIDARGIFQMSAGGAQRRLGYGEADRLGKSIHALFDRHSDVIGYYERALGGETHTQAIEINGTPLDVCWAPLRDAAGTITGVISMGFDVSERVRAQRESERARAAAEELAQLRNDFVAAVSHELRTPLTAIIGYAELLEARWRTLDEARRQEQIRRIVSAANRQKRLVEDLLMLGRLDDGDLVPAIEPTSLLAVCELAADEVRGSYRGQTISLAGPSDIQVAVDSGRLIQILINLIDNAAKYSPEGSPVDVTWEPSDAGVEIRVRDHGVGIASGNLPRLFTRFGRLPGSKARNGHVGTGLGLYLGRLLAEAMRGELLVESTGAEGTVFCLRLPLAGSAGARSRARFSAAR